MQILNKNNVSYKLWKLLIKDNKGERDLFYKNWFSLLLPNSYNIETFYLKNWLTFKDYISFFKDLINRSDNSIEHIGVLDFFNQKNIEEKTSCLPLCILYNVIEKKDFYSYIKN